MVDEKNGLARRVHLCQVEWETVDQAQSPASFPDAVNNVMQQAVHPALGNIGIFVLVIRRIEKLRGRVAILLADSDVVQCRVHPLDARDLGGVRRRVKKPAGANAISWRLGFRADSRRCIGFLLAAQETLKARNLVSAMLSFTRLIRDSRLELAYPGNGRQI